MVTDQDARDVVILAGDESLLGHPGSSSGFEFWRNRLEAVSTWDEGGWVPLSDAPAAYQGPEVGLAELYSAETARPLGLLKMALPGSSLSEDWIGQYTTEGFDALAARIRALMAAGPVRLCGLVWFQGIKDAADKRLSRAYDVWLTRFIDRMRVAIGVPDLPVLTVAPPMPPQPSSSAQVILRANGLCDAVRLPVSCSDLPGKEGRLTDDGNRALGRRLAHQLLAIEARVTGVARQRHWIWDDAQYQAWIEGPTLTPDGVLVTFPFVSPDHGFSEPAYAQRFAMSHGLTSLHLRAARNDWFQSDSFPALAAAMRAAIPENARVVTYGSSMGGFGALLFSEALRADRVIALAPQYSIDRADVPWETRWRKAAKQIGGFRHRLADHMRTEGDKIVLYDPLSSDARHVDMIPKGRGIHGVCLPFAAHHVGEYLAETNALPIVVRDILGKGSSRRDILRRVRPKRGKSLFYWQGRIEALLERGRLDQAAADIETYASLGGTERKLRGFRDALAKKRGTAAQT